jgi:hypothetical protein
LQKKPVFIDLVDPSKVPLKPQSMAPELPKGFSINGKPKGVEHHTETARPVPRMVPQRPVPPERLARTEAPREAPKADNAPGFHRVKKSVRHEKENHAKALRGQVTPKPDKESTQPKKMVQKDEKPVVSHPLTKEQIRKILPRNPWAIPSPSTSTLKRRPRIQRPAV